jgi:hypothetical protein
MLRPALLSISFPDPKETPPMSLTFFFFGGGTLGGV